MVGGGRFAPVRTVARLLLAALLAVVLVPALAAGQGAASPPDGTRVTHVPSVIRVSFPVPIEAALADARVIGPHGASSTSARVPADDPQALLIAVPSDGMGTYRAAWTVLTDDGHASSGSTAFAVSAFAPAAPTVVPRGGDGPGPLGIMARLLMLIGVLGTAGMAVTRCWVVGAAWSAGGVARPERDDADHLRQHAASVMGAPVRTWWRTWWALVACWSVGIMLALIGQATDLGVGVGEVGTLLTDSRWGHAWLVLLVLVAVATLAALLLRRGERPAHPGRAAMGMLAVPGLAAALAMAWAGHASSGTDATLGIAIDTVHGWATALWLGGLLALAVLAVPALAALPADDRVRLGAAVVVRFSALAVGAVVVLVVTGVYRALAELPSLDALWTTSYGVALLVKLLIFVVMLGVGAWNRFVIHPRLERAALGLDPGGDVALARLRVSVRAEVVLAVLVLVAVAVLVGIPPPT